MNIRVHTNSVHAMSVLAAARRAHLLLLHIGHCCYTCVARLCTPCRGVNYHTLHLQPPGPAATSKHHINSSCGGTLRQNGTTNSSTSTGSQLGACSSSPFYVAAADHTAGLPAAAALAPAVAGGAAAIAASVSSPGQQPQRAQKSLHPIQEQGAGQQADYDDCSSTSSSRRGSGLSPQISVPGVDVDVSPFASADSAKLSGQLSDTVVVRAAAVGAGNGHTTAANGAAVPAAGAAGCQKSFSVPAARLTGDQQPAQQLPASSSIPARVFAPKSSFRLGQVMTTPLQVEQGSSAQGLCYRCCRTAVKALPQMTEHTYCYVSRHICMCVNTTHPIRFLRATCCIAQHSHLDSNSHLSTMEVWPP